LLTGRLGDADLFGGEDFGWADAATARMAAAADFCRPGGRRKDKITGTDMAAR
jgi:hypothetical protein